MLEDRKCPEKIRRISEMYEKLEKSVKTATKCVKKLLEKC